MTKIIEILKSVRFQQLVVGLILVILGYYNIIPTELANIIAGFFGISIALGSADSIAKKVGGK